MRELFLYCAEAMLIVGVGHLCWIVLFYTFGFGASVCGIETGRLFDRGASAHRGRGDGEPVPPVESDDDRRDREALEFDGQSHDEPEG